MANSLAWVDALVKPKGFNGIVFWLRASDESAMDGAILPTIHDQTGNGHDFTQATGIQTPVYRIDQINGKAAFQFSGGQICSCPAFVFSTGQKFTVFCVFKFAAVTGIFLERTTNVNSFTVGFIFNIDGATTKLNSGLLGDVGFSQFLSNSSMDTTNWHNAIARGDKSLATNETTASYDGATAGTYGSNANNTNTFNGSHQMFFGARSGLTIPLNGMVAEIAVTNTIDPANEAFWNAYVSAQYGL